MLLNLDEILRLNTVKEIVDDIFSKLYTVRYVKYEDFKGRSIRIDGHYIKTKNSIKGDSHPFDLLAHVTEKYTREFYNNDRDKMNIENFLQDTRLDLYELLLKLGNGKIKGFEIKNVNDFKALLQDKEESMRARSYILRAIKSNLYKRNMCEGKLSPSSSHMYGKRVQQNGKRTIKWEKLEWTDIDKKIETKDDEVENSVLEIHMLKQSMLNNDIENLFSTDTTSNIYKYIIDNRNSIFTKKQLDYLKYILAGKDKRKYKRDYKFSYNRVENNIVKKAIEKLENNKYFYIVNGQLKQKQIDFLETVEEIINADSALEQFYLIQSILCNNNTYVNRIFIDLIYSLDEKIIRDLVFCLTDTVDENWIESVSFRKIIELLINEYNFQIKNAKLIYNYSIKERITKEQKLINYIEKNVFIDEDLEHGYIAKSNNNLELLTIDDIKKFINKIFNLDIDKRQVKFILDKYGYLLDTSKKTSKNKVGCYKLLRKHS